MAGFYGGDTEQMRAQAQACQTGSQRIQDLTSAISAFVDSVPWMGPDAIAFRALWHGTVKPGMIAKAEDIRAKGIELGDHATEQDSTSSAVGGGMIGAVPQLPPMSKGGHGPSVSAGIGAALGAGSTAPMVFLRSTVGGTSSGTAGLQMVQGGSSVPAAAMLRTESARELLPSSARDTPMRLPATDPVFPPFKILPFPQIGPTPWVPIPEVPSPGPWMPEIIGPGDIPTILPIDKPHIFPLPEPPRVIEPFPDPTRIPMALHSGQPSNSTIGFTGNDASSQIGLN